MQTLAQLSGGNSAALLFEWVAGSRVYGTATTAELLQMKASAAEAQPIELAIEWQQARVLS